MKNEENISGKDRIERFISLDWYAITGIIAAVLALVLHLLHLIDINVLSVIAVVLLALLFIRDIRRERDDESLHEKQRGLLAAGSGRYDLVSCLSVDVQTAVSL